MRRRHDGSRTPEARPPSATGCFAAGSPRGDDVHRGDVRRTSRFEAEQLLADLVALQQAVNVALDLDQATVPRVEVLAEVAGLQPICRSVVPTAGVFGGLDQLGGPLGSDQVTSAGPNFNYFGFRAIVFAAGAAHLAGGQIGWLGLVAKTAEALDHLRTEAACQGASWIGSCRAHN